MSEKKTLWDYFDKCDNINKKSAVCKICEKEYCCSTSYHLRAHLMKHDIYFDSQRNKPLKFHAVWNYFTSVDNEEKIASCNFCKSTCSYKSTTGNLSGHLRRHHRTQYERLQADSALGLGKAKGEEDGSALNSVRKKGAVEVIKIPKHGGRTALVWKHFEVCDENNRKAICKHCKGILSYKSTITNLKLHLKTKHVVIYEEFCQTKPTSPNNSDDDSNDSSDGPKTEDIWSYFERESADRARCAVCRITVPNFREVLDRHLKEKHPKLVPGAAIEETEVILKDEDVDDDDQDMYTEVIYLEEQPKDNGEKRKREQRKLSVLEAKPVRRKHSPIRLHPDSPKRRSKRRVSGSSDEYLVKKPKTTATPTVTTATEDDYEIESFGRYITCLLKKLPRSVCRKLQMNIVNLIMSANLNEEQNKVFEAVPITIQRFPIQTDAQGTSYIMVNEKGEASQNVTLTSTPQINNVQSHVEINTSPVQNHVDINTSTGTSCDVPVGDALPTITVTSAREE